MKIYQIHEYSGEWEDYRDYIVSSYLSKEKAEEEMERLIEKANENKRCKSCPLYFCSADCDLDCECGSDECEEYKAEEIKKYCDNYKIYKDEVGEYACSNYIFRLYDCYYDIKEVEVIE
jgi:hypothetical protein